MRLQRVTEAKKLQVGYNAVSELAQFIAAVSAVTKTSKDTSQSTSKIVQVASDLDLTILLA